jgi:Ca2+-binding RTX toxin-like protein
MRCPEFQRVAAIMVENTSTTPGTGANQSFSGTSGADSLSGGGGNDTITGGNGNDVLAGDGPLPGQWQFALYNYDFSSANNQTQFITSGTLVGRGYVDDFNVSDLANTMRGNPLSTDANDFGIIYTSTLNVSGGGTYTFSTTSDDGSRIIIRDSDGNIVFNLDNDYHQPLTTRSASVNLPAGQYSIEVLYWENMGQVGLSATVSGPDTGNVSTNLMTSPMIGTPPTVPGQVDGNDSIDAGQGSDTVFGNGGNDTLSGAAGNDSLNGGAGADSLSGGNNNDTLDGGTGDDILDGGNDNDTILGGAGNDQNIGGAGTDTVTYAASGAAVNANVTGGTAGDAAGDTYSSIEVLIGSAFDDTITGFATVQGGAGNDTISGTTGNDSLQGGTGNDTLDGGAGNDTLDGGADNDTILGGAGNDSNVGGAGTDTVTYAASGAAVNADIGGGTVGDAAGDTYSSIEVLIGSGFDDTITGFANAQGGAGNDTITGTSSADSLQGGTGNDTLVGGLGNDTIDAGADDDTIRAGAGDDTITTGAGADFIDGASFGGAGTTDRIIDFNGTLDIADLSSFFSQLNVLRANTVILSGNAHVTLPGGGTIIFNGITDPDQLTSANTLVPCFASGTLIDTPYGARPVETLGAGDVVLTRDGGPQRIVWAGSRSLSGRELEAAPNLAPVRIARGALGPDLPDRDLWVSPQHRMLLGGFRARLYAGLDEGFAAAIHLVGLPGIDRPKRDAVTYHHLLFDRHQVIRANGAGTESLLPSAAALDAFSRAARAEVLALFPDLASAPAHGPFDLSRPVLRRAEARLVLAA